MHELSIVMGIIDIARNELEKSKQERVESIELEIGSLSGVQIEALDFAWQMAVQSTVLEKAERKIIQIQAKARCISCGHIFETSSVFDSCPRCGELFSEIMEGKELRVKSLTVV